MFYILFILLLVFKDEIQVNLKNWADLEQKILWNKITKNEAKKRLIEIVKKLVLDYKDLVPDDKEQDWVFPVEDASLRDIGGKNGEGFNPNYPKPPYSFYDGNKHGGHPAHDIFILDKNGDCIHDKKNKPINVRSISYGIILSINKDFKPGKPRGGKYVWIFNPNSLKFYYYAHLGDIFVKEGDILKPGDKIGTVCNTGFVNRPTHLHLMILDYANGDMKPFDPYQIFKKSFNKN